LRLAVKGDSRAISTKCNFWKFRITRICSGIVLRVIIILKRSKDTALWLKLSRAAARLTQEQLAIKAGFDYKYYQRVESLKANLTLRTLSRISEALHISPAVFFKIKKTR